MQAEIDRLTDIQENASSLQLDIEQSFGPIEHDLDSIVHLQRRKQALSEAEVDFKRVENELFEL
jgi:hypothetical protein